jgi:hypothetical protein
VVLWHALPLALRDLAEVFLQRNLVFSHEAVRGRRSSRRSRLKNSVVVGAAGLAPVAAIGTSRRHT